jgi:very-short-patch-repair endonuclease
MYNCGINSHSIQFKREVRKIAEEKGKELGLTRGSVEWEKMVTKIRRELLKNIAKIEQNHNYITPYLRLAYRKNDLHTKLYDLKYIFEKDGIVRTLSILSDSENLTPHIVKWCMFHRHKLINDATEAELTTRNKLTVLSKINYIFQKPFFICESIYFADFYLPKYNTVIEVDGNYHNEPVQIQKDNKRTAYLESIGIKVIRITNEEALNTMRLYEEILKAIRRS